jgi:hypothetical protein
MVVYERYRRKLHTCIPLQEVSAYGYMFDSGLCLLPFSLRKVEFIVELILWELKE